MLVIFGSRMLSLKIYPLLMKFKIILERIGLQLPMLHNLKCCKNNWCLQEQFAPGKFGSTLSWKNVSVLGCILYQLCLGFETL